MREDMFASLSEKKSFTGKLKWTYYKLFFSAEKHAVS